MVEVQRDKSYPVSGSCCAAELKLWILAFRSWSSGIIKARPATEDTSQHSVKPPALSYQHMIWGRRWTAHGFSPLNYPKTHMGSDMKMAM